MRGGNSDITILPNVNTLQCILNVVGTKVKVSFDVPNSLASVIECKLHSGTLQHYSFVIYAWCISPSCLQFLPKCCSWAEEAPHNLIYLPVTVDVISTLSMWLTDQDGEVLDLRGEELTIRFHLRER